MFGKNIDQKKDHSSPRFAFNPVQLQPRYNYKKLPIRINSVSVV